MRKGLNFFQIFIIIGYKISQFIWWISVETMDQIKNYLSIIKPIMYWKLKINKKEKKFKKIILDMNFDHIKSNIK